VKSNGCWIGAASKDLFFAAQSAQMEKNAEPGAAEKTRSIKRW